MRSWDDYKKTMETSETLWSAAKANDVSLMAKLLTEGVLLDEKDHRGYSPLMLAVYAGNFEATEFLLARDADPNSCDHAGNSILMGAAFKGHREIAELLLKHGANLQTRNASGLNAADFANVFGRTEVSSLLAVAGASPKRVHRVLGLMKIIAGRFTTARA